MAKVVIGNLKKSFGRTEVIRGIELSIDDGEFVVIVGPSGCGKSTLLRMVAGLETVTSGKIFIADRLVTHLEPMDRDIAMVFQNYALYPHMSVFGNMSYGLKISGTPKSEITERVAAAARMLELEPFLDRKPRELSGGQRQRVAMGRAIVRKPSIFLFDEPLSNLDAKLRVQMRLEIKALQRELGVTSLYVTHDQVEAMTLADRVVVMNAGVADQVGAPLEVYRDPKTAFVAGFIGSPPTNFLAPSVVGHGPKGGQVGIRPEHLVICENGHLSATVAYAEALGAESLVHLKSADGSNITVRQAATVPLPEEGAAVELDWDASSEMHFAEDGRRVDPRHGT